MSVTVGFTAAALSNLALAMVAAGLLGRASGAHTPAGRTPYRLLALGTSLCSLGLVGTASLASVASHSSQVARLAPLAPLASGTAAGCLVLVLGVLRLPGAVPATGTAVRHVLDGSLIATCALYAGWTLWIEPAYHDRLGPGLAVLARPDLLVVSGPVALAIIATGVLAVAVWRAGRPRVSLAVTSTCVGLTSVAGVGLLVAPRLGSGGLLAGLGVAYGLGHLAVAAGARYTDRVVPAGNRAGAGLRTRGDALVTWVPVLCGIAAAAVRVTLVHSIDNVSAVIAGLIGVTLCARQASALREARGYADQLAREREALRELAHTDALTGLGNRRRLAEVLRQATLPAVLAARPGSAPGSRALLAIDLDGFKNVNDMRGHDAGDAVLMEVAERLRTNLRPGDLPVRLGGDEFAVLMWAGLDEAERVAGRLLAVLSQPYQVDGVAVFLSASIGIACVPGGAQAETGFGGAEHPPTLPGGAQAETGFGGAEHPPTLPGGAQPEPRLAGGEPGRQGGGAEHPPTLPGAGRSATVSSFPVPGTDGVAPDGAGALLRNADVSLRFAKQRGKNRIERYDAAYEQWLHRRTTLEQELRGALDRDELALAYQPVLTLPDGVPVGAEALLRWHHPSLGLVLPGEFIPVAEQAALVGALDRWVLHQACHQLSRWVADGHDVWVSVNVSALELRRPEYATAVAEVLRVHRLPPGRLILEVSEHAAAGDCAELVERLEALREIGVRIALDDFGAGYSSLSRLGRLPIDVLKIDRALVAGAPATFVEVAVGLGRRLGLTVIAEGVSDPAERRAVEAAGCGLGQGELLGRPMPAEHVGALLQQAAERVLQKARIPDPRAAQHLGQVDAEHEMRQA